MKPAQFHLITTLLATGAASFLSQTAHAQEFFSPLASNSSEIVSAGDLTVTGPVPTVGEINSVGVADSGAVTDTNAGLGLTVSGSGSGTVSLAGSSSYTGSTAISSGSLTLASGSILTNTGGSNTDTIDTSSDSGLTIGSDSTTLSINNLGGSVAVGTYALLTYNNSTLGSLGTTSLFNSSGDYITLGINNGLISQNTVYLTLSPTASSSITTSGSTGGILQNGWVTNGTTTLSSSGTSGTTTTILTQNTGDLSVIAGSNLNSSNMPTVIQSYEPLNLYNGSLELVATPEPSTWALFIFGLLGFAIPAVSRRLRRA